MTIAAKVVAASINWNGVKLPSVLARYPRFIHAEVMTHRVFSRNASSSRAIPVKRLIADIRRDPAMPIHWGKNQPGMQANEELKGWRRTLVRGAWLFGMHVMTRVALVADALGAHKQIVNRLVEPWAHINVLITATEWDNFFELRLHKDAQPEIRVLAEAIYKALEEAEYERLELGDWHMPFITPEERATCDVDTLLKLSVARCARTSYLTHDQQKPKLESDLRLYAKLVVATPLHASPAEHQATPDEINESGEWSEPELHGNFRGGWLQYRKFLEEGLV